MGAGHGDDSHHVRVMPSEVAAWDNRKTIEWRAHRAVLCHTGSSKINGAKLSDACSVRTNWLCMGWPFCLAELRREFQTGGHFFAPRCIGQSSLGMISVEGTSIL